MQLIKCDQCSTTTRVDTFGLSGWFHLEQARELQSLGDHTLCGDFCTATCVVEFLKAKAGVIV